MKTRLGLILLILLILAAAAGQARAEAYGWVDGDGVVHWEDRPPEGSARVRKVRTIPEAAAPVSPPAGAGTARGAARRASLGAPERALAQRKPAPAVELYTTSWCPWCEKARAYFTSRGIRVRDHDIEQDEGALQRKLGVDGDERVPTAIIGDKVVRGYSPAEYEAALAAP